MRIRDVRDILTAEVLCGEEMLDQEVTSACGADLMSDVLAFVKDQAVLLTGLLNLQVVRTAEMMDMKCIVVVRGKTPDEKLIDFADSRDIAMLRTPYTMYTACGKLYNNGLVGVE